MGVGESIAGAAIEAVWLAVIGRVADKMVKGVKWVWGEISHKGKHSKRAFEVAYENINALKGLSITTVRPPSSPLKEIADFNTSSRGF